MAINSKFKMLVLSHDGVHDDQLQKIYGHYDLGVYGRVLNKGTIKINDDR